MTSDDYLPVPWDFREVLDEAIQKGVSGRIHYFSPEPQVERVEGRVDALKKETSGEYLLTDKGEKVRLDKIITLFGKPGPAFDDYESYGNACMNCHDDEDD
ncbi:hypothetical protein EDD80_104126 [Anseongella ginsenosidimutans]|uniref:Uncharacterized protein n=1 Tax=Anseongella ginsenosidimutans TaxID=496056 RepID=A0A4V2UTV0_9SPHI|nr:hypothetical protein [Anseongella ginsenosidimutans]QEC53154.1 hypothetical protein FRZ59_12940 [Anseongella ginsenosidimutans]TCS87778.1 hypothetical protein EDD80_104126 [Anseongella ginsenosidimutans]